MDRQICDRSVYPSQMGGDARADARADAVGDAGGDAGGDAIT